MVQIILGVLLTGGILSAGQFVALASMSDSFLVLCFLTMTIFAILTTSKKEPQWVFLRRISGESLSKLQFVGVSAAASAIIMGLLVLGYHYPIVTLFATCITVITWGSLCAIAKKVYDDAKKARLAKMREYKNNPPPTTVRTVLNNLQPAASVTPEMRDAIANEVLDDYADL